MEADNLVRMANQIGRFFEAMPDRAEALSGIAQHVKSFWDPRMRRALLAHIDLHQGEGLDPMVLTALQQYRELLA
jgi:formate dehydrogenase subunit delta